MIRCIDMRRAVAAIGMALVGGLIGPAAWAQQTPDLALHLNLSASVGTGSVGTDLTAGVVPGAVSGYDPGVDSLAFRVGPLQAWFFHGTAPTRLKHDFRSGNGVETWTIEVTTPATGMGIGVAPGTAVTLAWPPPVGASGTCTGRTLTLVDPDGQVHDMTARREVVFAAPASGASQFLDLTIGAPGGTDQGVPSRPGRLFSPRHGRRGVFLVWDPVGGSQVAYQVERIHHPGDPVLRRVVRLTASPIAETRWLDADIVGQETVAYRVIAVSGNGCESAPSDALQVAP